MFWFLEDSKENDQTPACGRREPKTKSDIKDPRTKMIILPFQARLSQAKTITSEGCV